MLAWLGCGFGDRRMQIGKLAVGVAEVGAGAPVQGGREFEPPCAFADVAVQTVRKLRGVELNRLPRRDREP